MEVREQNKVLENIRESKGLDFVKWDKQKSDNARQVKKKMWLSAVSIVVWSTPEIMPCIWQNVWWLWQDQPLQDSLQVNAEAVSRPEVIEGWKVSAWGLAVWGAQSKTTKTAE